MREKIIQLCKMNDGRSLGREDLFMLTNKGRVYKRVPYYEELAPFSGKSVDVIEDKEPYHRVGYKWELQDYYLE